METIRGIRFYAAFLFLCAFALSGCVKEPALEGKRIGENDVTVVIKIPGSTVTRAISEGGVDDNAVTRADILLFDLNNAERYAGRVSTSMITTTGINTKSFTVKIPEGNYEIMILANAEEIVDYAISSLSLTIGTTTKAEAYPLLRKEIPDRTTTPEGPEPLSGVWNAQPGSSGYVPFPMWGEVALNTEVSTTVSATLVRMLAKINLTFLNQTISDKLELEEIYLCNYNKRGFLASRNWINLNTPSPTATGPDAENVTKMSSYGFRLVYTNTASFPNVIRTVNGVQVCQDEIFLVERFNTSTGTTYATDEICLIIKGKYDGDSESSYYRINMINAGNFLHIIRNHNYQITIQDVIGPGANTGELAYDSETVNIVATVRPWDAGYEVDVDYTGQYQMIVNQSEFDFGGSGTPDQLLEVFSNHPDGWIVEFEGDAGDWINVSPDASTDILDFVNVMISCGVNDTGSPRTGTFYIVTPLLRKAITVNQEEYTPVPITPGGSADILYFDGDILEIGKWKDGAITPANMAFFKFGGVTGFINSNSTWAAGNVIFNTTGATYGNYPDIPAYDSDDFNAAVTNVSMPNYHTGANVLAGKGDPCKLVGLTGAQIRGMTAAEIDAYNSGWRLPVPNENVDFVAAPTFLYFGFNVTLDNNHTTFWGYTGNDAQLRGINGGWFPIPGSRDSTTGRTTISTDENGFLPAAGYCGTDGLFMDFNNRAGYWTSNVYSNTYGADITFYDSAITPKGGGASGFGFYDNGLGIRCIRQAVYVTPGNVTLDAEAQSPATQSLAVTTQDANGYPDPGKAWMLTSSDSSWLTLSLNPSGAGAGASVNGTGSQTVYLVVTENTTGAERSATIYLDGASANIVSVVTQTTPGGSADILYFDGDVVRVGRWGVEVNSNNIAFFQFGSTIGFLNGAAWDASQVRFNTTSDNTSFDTYGGFSGIPRYDAWNTNIANSPLTSDPVYHNGVNVLQGRGDPCQLAGRSAATIRGLDAGQIDALSPSGWRMPTAEENALYAGGPDAATWVAGNTAYTMANLIIGFWNTNLTTPPSPTVSTGTRWNGARLPVQTPDSSVLNAAGTFLPAAASRGSNGAVNTQGVTGDYWASTPLGSNYGYSLFFNSATLMPVSNALYATGNAVRCVRM